MRSLPLALILLAACSTDPGAAGPVATLPVGQAGTVCVDNDFDGFCAGQDCNDNNFNIYPGAFETVGNGVDENCDGVETCFVDGDHDDYGTSSSTAPSPDLSCLHAGLASVAGDCDDGDSATHPGATEIVADDVDEDCDGRETCHADADFDGYGDATATRISLDLDCADAGEAYNASDCDDALRTVFPGAIEVAANGHDDNCDGTELCYVDGDNDGYGSSTTVASADVTCTDPGESPNALDCNDAHATIHPGATEVCDPADIDENCNGSADDLDLGATGKTSWYIDGDSDGYGAGTAFVACDPPSVGMAAVGGDCNDIRADINPGEVEACDLNNTDEDCNGVADDADGGATNKTDWYADADADRYGVGSPTTQCDAPPGKPAGLPGDCDDADAGRNPGLAEVCDAANKDEDCNGLADDDDAGATNKTNWYADADADHYGVGTADVACDATPGHPAALDGDCDDANPVANPGGTEVCDPSNVDEDCDGEADDNDSHADGKTVWYVDADADGYGAGAQIMACDQPANAPATVAGDCDDRRPAIHPGGKEVCDPNNRDEDCNGLSDDDDPGVTNLLNWYTDVDNDGFGTGDPEQSCDPIDVFRSRNDTDCDDANAGLNPGATDIPCDTIDQDCSGADAVDAFNCMGAPDTDTGGDTAADTDGGGGGDTDVSDTDVTSTDTDTQVDDTDATSGDTDTTPNDTDTTGTDKGPVCGCDSSGGPAPALGLLLAAAALARRRRR